MEKLRQSPARLSGLMMVELTGTCEIEQVDEAVRTAQALRGLGVRFCIDDFGAGSADVRHLRALSPDIVKLDGSYVPGVAQEGRQRAFMAGMVEIARAAGARTVAERIETEAEAEALCEIGVELGQGWLFGRPGPLPPGPGPNAVAPASRAVFKGVTPRQAHQSSR
jgi:EAL domain-containing protein (putative c-di-GMP-specific phosphodiesterase class I)